jgi:F1F0 ATPase subunit 2
VTDEAIGLAIAFAAGMLLGVVFFWGLWMTVATLHSAPRPGLRILGSLLLRFALVAAGLTVAARYGGWQHVIAAAVGFMLARVVLVRRVVPARPDRQAGS